MTFRLEDTGEKDKKGKPILQKVPITSDAQGPVSRESDPNTEPCVTCADFLGSYRTDRPCGHEGKKAFVPEKKK